MADWEEKWDKTKEDFKGATDKSKPDAKDAFGRVKAAFTTHKSNISKTLKKVDESHVDYRNNVTNFGSSRATEKDVNSSLNTFGRAVADFKSSKADYGKIISAVVDKELAKDPNKTVYYRACKAMTKQLDLFEAQIEASQKELFDTYMDNVKMLETGQAKSTDERKQDVINALFPSVGVSLKQAAAFAARCKVLRDKGAGQTPPDAAEAIAYYEKNLQKAARDVTQPLGNIAKHLGKAVPANDLAFLVARNKGSYHVAPATVAGFGQELVGFIAATKAVQVWYDQNK